MGVVLGAWFFVLSVLCPFAFFLFPFSFPRPWSLVLTQARERSGAAMNRQKLAHLVVWGLLLTPAAASAQVTGANIAGVVRDTSGAVLPGVTVEAASPALI